MFGEARVNTIPSEDRCFRETLLFVKCMAVVGRIDGAADGAAVGAGGVVGRDVGPGVGNAVGAGGAAAGRQDELGEPSPAGAPALPAGAPGCRGAPRQEGVPPAWSAAAVQDSLDVDAFLRKGVDIGGTMGVSSQAGKSRPETGVYLRDGSEVSRNKKSGDVNAEIVVNGSDGEKMAILVGYSSPWPLGKKKFLSASKSCCQ